MGHVYFENIENVIFSAISVAEKRIYIAVAWFTNRILFEELNNALQRNVEIKVLILDDILNRNEFGLDFGLLVNNGADIRFASSQKGIMHNKFCVIDDHVITGSYNWTNYANLNNENIVVIDEPNIIYSFCSQFEKLFNSGKPLILPYEHLIWTDVKEGDFSELRRNIFRDVVSQNDMNRDIKRIKLINLNQAFKSGDIEEVRKASMLSIEGRLRTITDVLTSRNHDFAFKLWEENILGKPYNNTDGYDKYGKWFFIPNAIKEDKYHSEYIEGTLKPEDSRNYVRAKGLKLTISDCDYILTIKRILGSKTLSIYTRDNIPDNVLCIDYARLTYYQFPSPMFNQSLPRKGENGKPKLLKGINIFAIAKSVDGGNIDFFEGWNPVQRGERIVKEFFAKEL